MHTYLHGWKDRKSTSEDVSKDTSGPAQYMWVRRVGGRGEGRGESGQERAFCALLTASARASTCAWMDVGFRTLLQHKQLRVHGLRHVR